MSPPEPLGQALARVVYGVPLDAGERVLYFKANARLGRRIFWVILGIPMILMFGLGLYLIYSAITDRKSSIYAQALTNRRLLAINGRGAVRFSVRWDEVAGMNKVTGKSNEFGVRNAAGARFMYEQDLVNVERLITQFVQSAQLREQAPEVPFQSDVT